ncbi:MAG: acyltransferase [Ilumatobacteraceae bacterium]
MSTRSSSSGWLITWKLSGDRDRDIDLRRFWTARARRLPPASLSVLVAVALVWPLAGVDVPSLRRDLVFAAGWMSNWGTITSGGDYWARFGEPSPVSHFWSLAIEEQFYLVWPALVAACIAATRRQRSRGARRSAGGAALGSIVFMWSPSIPPIPRPPTCTPWPGRTACCSRRCGSHTPARATAASVGARWLDAPLTRGTRRREHRDGRVDRRPRPGIDGADVPLGASGVRTGDGAGGVVAAADGAGSRVLAAPAMRAGVADRSYGLTCGTGPQFLLPHPRLGVDGAVATAGLDVVRVAVAGALADVSLRWLESPQCRRRVLLTLASSCRRRDHDGGDRRPRRVVGAGLAREFERRRRHPATTARIQLRVLVAAVLVISGIHASDHVGERRTRRGTCVRRACPRPPSPRPPSPRPSATPSPPAPDRRRRPARCGCWSPATARRCT